MWLLLRFYFDTFCFLTYKRSYSFQSTVNIIIRLQKHNSFQKGHPFIHKMDKRWYKMIGLHRSYTQGKHCISNFSVKTMLGLWSSLCHLTSGTDHFTPLLKYCSDQPSTSWHQPEIQTRVLWVPCWLREPQTRQLTSK